MNAKDLDLERHLGWEERRIPAPLLISERYHKAQKMVRWIANASLAFTDRSSLFACGAFRAFKVVGSDTRLFPPSASNCCGKLIEAKSLATNGDSQIEI